ncbi:MAG: hypothetical protein GY820_21080 [Gammaproteobacteria bacterium]|nr:hypothetical protein [Gammaproteobacteria bacterium]
MSLKGCIKKAEKKGEVLDEDDKKYLLNLIRKGEISDEKALNLLEDSIVEDMQELVDAVEAKGIVVKREQPKETAGTEATITEAKADAEAAYTKMEVAKDEYTVAAIKAKSDDAAAKTEKVKPKPHDAPEPSTPEPNESEPNAPEERAPTSREKAAQEREYKEAYEGIYENKFSIDYLNLAVASMISHPLERAGKSLILSTRFPIYVDVADKIRGIYDGSPALQKLIHTITGEGADKVKKSFVLAKMAAINAQRTEIIKSQITKIDHLSKDLSPTQLQTITTLVTQANLHDYFVLAHKLKTVKDIDEEADRLHKKLWVSNPRAVRDVEQLVALHVGGRPEGVLYNLDAGHYPQGGDFGNELRKLQALKSIQEVGTKRFVSLLKHKELMAVIKDNSVANAVATVHNGGTASVRDSLVMDKWKEPMDLKAISKEEFKQYEYGENTGWKILQEPEPGKLGIVYKPIIDSTSITGAYTDTKLTNTDIPVLDKYRRFDDVYKTRDGSWKLVLNAQQKKELGIVSSFSQRLVHSTAHSISIQESQIIRDVLLQKETWRDISKSAEQDSLVDIINSDNIDNPWFLKLGDASYNSLPKRIKAKYMPVGNRASNVKGFNDNVDLVRKDISHWLLGDSSKSLANNPKMKWAIRLLKGAVFGSKIGMVVLNPVKIANDNMSNLAYLGVMGVSPQYIARNYREISKDFAEYSTIQRQIVQLKLRLMSRPKSSKLKTKLKGLQNRLKRNSIGDIGDKGFVNSLGSDLVSRDADTLSGFQADVHKGLEYLLTNKNGDKNATSRFIVKLQELGWQSEGFFDYIANIAGRYESTKLVEQEFDQIANRIRKIKTDDDVVNYVAQITTSPSSELVRLGSAMTDLTDVMAKETLYRHFVENKKMNPEDAKIKVLDSFPDYKENMPLEIKELSDVGIIMFPTFWMRIQKAIYRMARDRPVNLASEMMIQEMLGSDVNTIFESNVLNKANTFGGLVHPPFEPVGVNSFVPKEIFGNLELG